MSSRALVLSALSLVIGCAAEAESVDTTRGAESASTSFYLVPVDARARALCHDETERRYCSSAAVEAARSSCAETIGASGWFDACTSGGEGCMRVETYAGACVEGPVYPDADACKNPQPQNCSFYAACLEQEHPCGDDGYALGYGEKYCYAFKNNTQFTAAGRAFRDATMLCLQRHLAAIEASSLASMSCTAITDSAFDSHPGCYTQPGTSICDLGPWDALQVLHTIDGKDLFSSRALKQEAAVVRTCIFDIGAKLFFAPSRAAQMSVAASAEPSANAANGESAELAAKYDFWLQMDREVSEKLAR